MNNNIEEVNTNDNKNKCKQCFTKLCSKKKQINSTDQNGGMEMFDKHDYEYVDENLKHEPDETMKQMKGLSTKSKAYMSRRLYPNKQVEISNPIKINIINGGKNMLMFVLNFVKGFVGYIFVYGTELIVQMMAICMVSVVMVLKYLENFVKSRTLTIIIAYIESMDLSKIQPHNFTLSLIQITAFFRRIAWITWKLLEFSLIIIKHLLVQLFIAIVALISLTSIYMFQLLTRVVIIPTVNKTMNMLKLDPAAVSQLANVQVNKIIIALMFKTMDATPLISKTIISLGNFRFHIIKVNIIRDGILGCVSVIHTVIEVIVDVFYLIMSIVQTLSDLQSSILNIIVLLANSLSLICLILFHFFNTLQNLGYFIGMFLGGLSKFTDFFSRLQSKSS